MQSVLEGLYTETFGAEKLTALRAANTKAPAPASSTSPAPSTPAPAVAPTLDLAAYFSAMRDELIAAQPVAEPELVQLAADRSAAIRGYLVEMQTIPVERIDVSESDVHDDDEDWVRCKLGLEAME
jgi:hypothetical protein